MKAAKKADQGADGGAGRVSRGRPAGGSRARTRGNRARAGGKTRPRHAADNGGAARATCAEAGATGKAARRAPRRDHRASTKRIRRNRAGSAPRCHLPPSVAGLFNRSRATAARHPTLRVRLFFHQGNFPSLLTCSNRASSNEKSPSISMPDFNFKLRRTSALPVTIAPQPM